MGRLSACRVFERVSRKPSKARLILNNLQSIAIGLGRCSEVMRIFCDFFAWFLRVATNEEAEDKLKFAFEADDPDLLAEAGTSNDDDDHPLQRIVSHGSCYLTQKLIGEIIDQP